MAKRPRFLTLSTLAIATVGLLGFGLLGSVASAGGPRFDPSNVAHRYNFSVAGTGYDNNVLAMNGWFEAAPDGRITDGNVHLSYQTWVSSQHQVRLNPDTANNIHVSDGVNGAYGSFMQFGDKTEELRFFATFLFDDPGARTGSVTGRYFYNLADEPPVAASGVLSGDVVMQ